MPTLTFRVRSVLPLVLVAGLAAGVLGCGGDGVTLTTAPKAEGGPGPQPQPGGGGGAAAGEYRILGALFPADAPEWYFKYTGPSDQLASYEAEFDKLVQSVKLQPPPGTLPAFDKPAGWTATGPQVSTSSGIPIKTDETLKFGKPDAPQQVTITYIPGGTIDGNLARWAKQVGAADFARQKNTQTFDANGTKGLRVDVRGPNNPAGGKGPMMGGK